MLNLRMCYDKLVRLLPLCKDQANPGDPLSAQSEHDMIWIRQPFLFCGSKFEELIVHGHTPIRTGQPDVRENRVNLDTGAVYGGPLTVAIFSQEEAPPLGFLHVH